VAFTENDYFPLPDFDNDYYTNINELEQRTSPFSSTPSKPMGSIAGTWQVTETITSASGVCSGDVNSVATYNMNIQETGNSIFINVDSMSGTLSAALIGQRLVWAGSLSDATSTLTVNETDIQVSGSCNTLSGTFGWSWSDVSNSCTGQSNIEAVRTVANGCGTNAYAESEPNDLLSSANVINEVPISITGSTQGDLQNSDFSSDIDHYLIDFTSPSKIIVRLEGVDTNADIDLYVYTEDFVEIVSSGNVGPNEQLELTINQLPLYIGVLPWSVPNTATYTLSVSGL
jgi:hypothetical protein